MSERAVVIADQAMEVVRAAPRAQLPVVLRDAMLDGLVLGQATVRAVAVELEEAVARKAAANAGPGREEPVPLVVDEKLLRLGNDTAMALCRLGMRAIEGEFRARRDDVLGKLLQEIAASRAVTKPEK